jgi:glucose-1-phosphate adenylyltransferase
MVKNSILLDNTRVGKNCKIQNAIFDKDVTIPDGIEIGFNPQKDSKKYTLTDTGIIVVPRNTVF